MRELASGSVGGGDDVDRRDGEGEGSGVRPPEPSGWARRRAHHGEACGGPPRASSRSEQERRRMDGRFRRCAGCQRVHVFCGPCASVGACCEGCAASRRRETHRRANRAYAQTPQGVASNRARQVRRRRRNAL